MVGKADGDVLWNNCSGRRNHGMNLEKKVFGGSIGYFSGQCHYESASCIYAELSAFIFQSGIIVDF